MQDNGTGMEAKELAEWAVMNLSMEDRGAKPEEPTAEQAGAGRFLTGALSYFGVGAVPLFSTFPDIFACTPSLNMSLYTCLPTLYSQHLGSRWELKMQLSTLEGASR